MDVTAGDRRTEVRRAGPVLEVRLARPDRDNAIDDLLLGELARALDEAEADPECRLVVLRGGDGVFSTGMDFAAAAGGGPDGDTATAREFFRLMDRFSTVPRTVVSVVDGRVSGGGVGLVAASDVVYATPRSTFALPEALWGLLPCCVLPFVADRTGIQHAYAMALSTQPVPAAQAAAWSLVDEVTDTPDTAVRRLAFRAVRLPGPTVGDLKRYVRPFRSRSAEVERHAVTELARLLAEPAVRQRIDDFVTHRRFPWER